MRNSSRAGTSRQVADLPQYYLCYVCWARRHPWLLKRPFSVLQFLFCVGHALVSDGGYFAHVLGLAGASPSQSLDVYREELLSNDTLRDAYMSAVESGELPFKYDRYEDRILNATANVVNYYALIRETRPRVVVETGTATGSMTSWVLAALVANGTGRLISIDIPPVAGALTMGVTVPAGRVGFLIPEEYRTAWQYIAGDAKVHLPRVLAENEVQVFIHDSLHTRTHMLFEYSVARALMPSGAFILSDDVLHNRAFFCFVAAHGLRSVSGISNPNLGLTVSVFDDIEREIGTGIVPVPGEAGVADAADQGGGT